MYSNKTSQVINAYNRHIIGGRKCILVKYSNDTRYSNDKVITHSGIALQTTAVCNYLFKIDHFVRDYDVICIDEIQFYPDAAIFCDKWANEGLIIEAGGLGGTFERKSFDVITELIPRAEQIIWNQAVCRENGNEASFSMRTSSEKEVQIIGGTDKYEAVDRKNYFEKYHHNDLDQYLCIEFLKFLDNFNKEYPLHLERNPVVQDQLFQEFQQKKPQCYTSFLLDFLNIRKMLSRGTFHLENNVPLNK
jgi:thymidine kinase